MTKNRIMSSSDPQPSPPEPPEVPETPYEIVPFNSGASADQVHGANGQSCKTTNPGDNSTESIGQEDFVSNCKAWEKWYNLKQRDCQTVLQFTDYLQKVLNSLPRHGPGEPSMNERFHRLRSSLRDPIKAELDVQIVQPTTFDDLVKVASWIEEKEMNLLGHTILSRRNPLLVLPKPSKSPPSNYRPKPSPSEYIPLHRTEPAPNKKKKYLGPTPSRVSKRSKRQSHDIYSPRHHGFPLDQISIGDKNNKIHCYICRKPNHITSECPETCSKFFGALSFPVRPRVPENP